MENNIESPKASETLDAPKTPESRESPDPPESEAQGTTTNKILVYVAGALIVSAITYIASVIDHYRVSQLEFVNKQIEKLYGPLYALTQANNDAWNFFFKNTFPGRSDAFNDDDVSPPTVEQVDAWRLSMREVFQPFNKKIEDVVVNNSQLIIGTHIPRVFLDLTTHTEAYKAVMANWKPNDRANAAQYVRGASNLAQGLNYPDDIVACAQASYELVRLRTEELEGAWGVFIAWKSGPKQVCVCDYLKATDKETPDKCIDENKDKSRAAAKDSDRSRR